MNNKTLILILAEDLQQAIFISNKNKLEQERWKFISDDHSIQKFNDYELWLYGTYEHRKDYLEIIEYTLAHGCEVRQKI